MVVFGRNAQKDGWRVSGMDGENAVDFTLGVLSMVTLDPSRIPLELHGLLPLAEKFGVSDDCLRERLVNDSSALEISELKAGICSHEDALDNWLAGPEAQGPSFSDEYIAFSAMRMAADYA